MSSIKSICGWFFRQGMVFGLIVAAVTFHQFIWPMISDGAVKTAVSNEWKSPDEIKVELNGLKQQAINDLKASETEILTKTGSTLTAALHVKRRELANVEQDLGQRVGIFASISPTAIIAKEKLKLKASRLSAEIRLLETVEINDNRRLHLNAITYPTQNAVDLANKACKSASNAAKAFNRLSAPERAARNLIYSRAAKLAEATNENCKKYKIKRLQRQQGLAAGKAARAKFEESQVSLSRVRNNLTNGLANYAPDAFTEKTIKSLLLKSLLILISIIAMPFVIRTLFYYIFAPLAERRASIRITVPGGENVPIPPSEHSRVSISIILERGKELLVRQDYLQTSSLTGKKDTRWLLDYRHFLSSIFSGMSFLTRIRGEGEMTTVSAVRDPFAELTEVILPLGAACALHPRALVAVVQPEGRAMRITSHWRLFSLSAWLTLQLRYMVFHGPGSLIVKGGRGIRVERAESGRIFGQDQLVGFSIDLAYSVTRTETFGPYFFGREQLFKDKVEQGSGVLIIEEAPLSSRSGSGVRRGLEGMFDAGLKAFGI